MLQVLSVCCVFSSRCLTTTPNRSVHVLPGRWLPHDSTKCCCSTLPAMVTSPSLMLPPKEGLRTGFSLVFTSFSIFRVHVLCQGDVFKKPWPSNCLLLFLVTWLLRRYLAMDVFFSSSLPAFSCHITVYFIFKFLSNLSWCTYFLHNSVILRWSSRKRQLILV